MPSQSIQNQESRSSGSTSTLSIKAHLESCLNEGIISLFPPLDDERKWQEAFEKLGCDVPAILAAGEKAAAECDFAPIPDDLYLEFSRNGVRVNYERVNMRKHQGLHALVLAECAERRGRFIPDISRAIDGLFLKAKSWVLPAHDGNNTNFYGTRVTVDLGSSMSAAWLTDILNIFGDRLDPKLRAALTEAILQRVGRPVIESAMGLRPPEAWMSYRNNWIAVCFGCSLRAILGLDLPREQKIAVAADVVEKIPDYFHSFSADGMSSEGEGYWQYGFSHYTLLAEVLRLATGGRIDLLDDPFVKLAARGPALTSMAQSVHATFSDMPIAFSKSPSGLLAWLDSRMGWGLGIERRHLTPCSDVGALFAFHAEGNPVLRDPLGAAVSKYSTFMPDAGMLISRAPDCSQPFALAIKCGHNAEQHNHNDVGSYCILLGDDWLAVDPGAEVYTARTFGPHRYDSPLNNSFGHDVPRLGNRQLQSTGEQFRGKVLDCTLTPEHDFYRIDIAAAYEFPPLVSLVRSLEAKRKGASASFAVEDSFEYTEAHDFETAIIIFGKAERTSADTIVIHRITGDHVPVRVKASAPWTFSCEELDCTLKSSEYPRPSRIAVKLASPAASGFVRVEYGVTEG